MSEFSVTEIVKIALTILGTGSVAAAITAYFNRNKGEAETKKLKAETVLTFADGWEKLAKEYKDGMEKGGAMNETMRKQIVDLTELIESERRERAEEKAEESENRRRALAEKDEQILKITTRLRTVEDILIKNGIALPTPENP